VERGLLAGLSAGDRHRDGAVGLLGFIRRYGRIALVALGLIGAVVLTAVFWLVVVKLAVGALSIALFAVATKRF
jgi:hypothetical protein